MSDDELREDAKGHGRELDPALEEWVRRRDQRSALIGGAELIQVVVTSQHGQLYSTRSDLQDLTLQFDDPEVTWTKAVSDEAWVLLVQLIMELLIVDAAEGEEVTPLFDCSATVGVALRVPLDVDADDVVIDLYARTTVALLAFPYLRATLQRLTVDAGLPPAPVPFYRYHGAGFPAFGDDEDDEQPDADKDEDADSL